MTSPDETQPMLLAHSHDVSVSHTQVNTVNNLTYSRTGINLVMKNIGFYIIQLVSWPCMIKEAKTCKIPEENEQNQTFFQKRDFDCHS